VAIPPSVHLRLESRVFGRDYEGGRSCLLVEPAAMRGAQSRPGRKAIAAQTKGDRELSFTNSIIGACPQGARGHYRVNDAARRQHHHLGPFDSRLGGEIISRTGDDAMHLRAMQPATAI